MPKTCVDCGKEFTAKDEEQIRCPECLKKGEKKEEKGENDNASH